MGEYVFAGDFTALTVDDDVIFLDLVETMLNEIGVKKVIRADSGVNAYQALASMTKRVDCIISDLKMPNGNGLQLLREVRLGRFKLVRPDACFIMLSGITHPLAVKTAAQLDVSCYLTKPVTQDGLKAGILKGRSKVFPVDFAKYASVAIPGAANAA